MNGHLDVSSKLVVFGSETNDRVGTDCSPGICAGFSR